MAAAKAKAVSNEVLDLKLAAVDGRLEKIDATLTKVSESLVELVRLEERFVALSNQQTGDRVNIADHGRRIEAIEKVLPPLMEARKWVIMGVLGIVSMVGLTVYNNFFSKSTATTRAAQVSVSQPVVVPPAQ